MERPEVMQDPSVVPEPVPQMILKCRGVTLKDPGVLLDLSRSDPGL